MKKKALLCLFITADQWPITQDIFQNQFGTVERRFRLEHPALLQSHPVNNTLPFCNEFGVTYRYFYDAGRAARGAGGRRPPSRATKRASERPRTRSQTGNYFSAESFGGVFDTPSAEYRYQYG
ncbi:hypothetical protein EVAR_86788_1 [Eumeta japonica]|uniref:Uncharacterized protein n=1 Tax=Eumeta variegata TaxID=151549 RepID=A0A4C1W2Z2_EUMVA|nr:hypothetical protein EVAR_86788_1 [Eumeta japonica]